MRRSVVVGSALALALCVGLALGVPPLVGYAVERKALSRGVALDVGSVALGWSGVWLKDVTASLSGVARLSLHLDAVRVGLGWDLSAREVQGEGGNLKYSGGVEELRTALDQWRSSRAGNTSPEASSAGGGRQVNLREVTLELDLDDMSVRAWGGAVALGGAEERLSFQLAQVQTSSGSARAEGGTLALRREPQSGLAVQHAELDQLSVTWTFREETNPAPPTAPATAQATAAAQGTAPAAAPVTAAPAATPKAALLARFAGKDGVRPKAVLDRAAQWVGRHMVNGGSVKLRAFAAQVHSGAEQMNLGPATLSVTRQGETLLATFHPLSDAGDVAFNIDAEIGAAAGPAKLRLGGGPVSLASFGIREGDLGLIAPDAATLSATTEVVLSADGSDLTFEGSGSLMHLSLRSAALSDNPVMDLNIAWSAKGGLRLDGTHFKLENAQLRVGETRSSLQAEILRTGEHFQTSIKGGIPLAACQAMLESTPDALIPLLKDMRLGGSFSFDAALTFDTARPADFVVSWNVLNECKFQRVPEDVDPARFRSTFRYQVQDVDGKLRYRETGPAVPGWVPLTQVSRHVETAVLVCEDSRFRSHDGFDKKAINDAIHDNMQAGRFVRGASTISMQLAKNLYLGREKTLSRKIQEALLTMLLEQELSKDEILETYLNVIEYGPGVYGIGEAAEYYFGVSPMDLTLGQAMYLGSILPSPGASHFTQDRALSEGWTKYLRHLMQIAHKIKRVTDEELESGLMEELVFGESPDAESQLEEEGETGRLPDIVPPPIEESSPPRSPPRPREP